MTYPQPDVPPPPPPDRRPGFDLGDFLSFRYLITPGFITVIYVVGAVLITVTGLGGVAVTQGGGGALAALAFVVLANLWWRVVLEFVMVLFRINDSLASIDRRGRGM